MLELGQVLEGLPAAVRKEAGERRHATAHHVERRERGGLGIRVDHHDEVLQRPALQFVVCEGEGEGDVVVCDVARHTEAMRGRLRADEGVVLRFVRDSRGDDELAGHGRERPQGVGLGRGQLRHLHVHIRGGLGERHNRAASLAEPCGEVRRRRVRPPPVVLPHR